MAARRSAAQWNALSDAQRKRYISAGRSGRLSGTPGLTAAQARSYYLSGGSLQAARGKHPPRADKRTAPPQAALKAAQRGEATPRQLEQLRTWQRRRAPKWIRESNLSEDTAAIVANAGLSPAYWKDVQVFPREDGSYDVYVTSKRGGPTRRFNLPDRETLSEVERLIDATNGLQVERREGEYVPTSFTVIDTDLVLPASVESRSFTRSGNALPRKATNGRRN